ncbi:MAG: hypothetical protein HYU80_02785 [Candidatus Blackburnbacteria bacterium]|nr:hypothetical protein [Candidatus Blackburnbacteria bacterium]
MNGKILLSTFTILFLLISVPSVALSHGDNQGSGKNRIEVKIENRQEDEILPTPTTTASDQTATPAAVNSDTRVEIKAKVRGPRDEVAKFLEQILTLLKDILKK